MSRGIKETSSDAWSAVGSPARDPWAPAQPPPPADPWAPAQSKSPTSMLSSPSSSELEQFDALSKRTANINNGNGDLAGDPFDLSALTDGLTPNPISPPSSSTGAIKKSPSAFLGENSSLVNLDRLLQPSTGEPPAAAANPFADTRSLFQPPPPARLTINELKQQQMGLTGAPFPAPAAPSPAFAAAPYAAPLAPLAPQPVSSDPWAPVGPVAAPRTSSPWSPQQSRHTPNPFLS
ncbi:hypothetical protein O0L34_g8450 [Tuta absoluta]|nr:hypothetical protein O0L34_g8450 [Tuta absoluta]